MASNNPTFELGFFENLEDLQNVSEMVETSETSDVLKDKQLSESARLISLFSRSYGKYSFLPPSLSIYQ